MDWYIEYFKFETQPQVEPRTPLKGMTDKQLKSIKKYPYVVKEDCGFEFKVNYGGKSEIFTGTIPEGFYYNQADIPFLLQLISYDKHSPFVKDASLIHDYLLFMKVYLYNHWKMDELGFSVADFRKMTSKIFELALIRASVPQGKAHLMAICVDVFQALLFWDWGRCDTPNYMPEDNEWRCR